MPLSKSAKKELRKTVKRTAQNIAIKKFIKEEIKKIDQLIEDNKGKEAAKSIPILQKKLDKAVKSNTLPKNKVNRMKSRLTKQVNKLNDSPKKKK